MKYLKQFESKVDNRGEFIELTNNYLAYLIDDGLTFGVSPETYPDTSKLPEERRRMYDPTTLRPYYYVYIVPKLLWEDCKDTIIPYLEVIKSKYRFRRKIGFSDFSDNKVIDIVVKDNDNPLQTVYLSLDELFNDNYKINNISLDKYVVTKIRFRIYV